MTSESTTQSEHQELMLKLPWLLNGTLTEPEAATVREHVAHCDHCQNEMESLSIMNKGITETSRDTGDAAASFSKMRQRIAAEPSKPAGNSVTRLIASIGRWLPTTPAPQWAIASVGGLLLAFVLLLQTDMMGSSADDSYRVLSSDTAVNTITVVISFDEDANDVQSEAALATMTKQMSFESTWVKSAEGNYQLSVNGPADESTVSPLKINLLIEALRSIPSVKTVGIAP